MIVKVQPSRKHSSSFKRLREYLTQERDAETGELVLRGDVVLSWNLLGFDTAAGEMQGVASLNDRCKDAVCHYELSWPPGERPTRSQWTDSALHTLKALGYEDHQFMIVAHDDKRHFHIHIMLNKVHPETLRAPTRYNNWLALDAAARLLEAKYGWAHTPGMTRWDEESKQAVPISRSERNALRYARQQPTGAAAKFEHYHDEESLQTYIRREVAPLGFVHASKNFPADSFQFIGNLVGQWEDERCVNALKRNVQPRAVIKRLNLRLSGLGFEIHDDVLGQGILVADFQNGKKLAEIGFGEFEIHREPDLSPLLCGCNDSALRAGSRLLLRGHVVFFS
jgi:hypothetical protein